MISRRIALLAIFFVFLCAAWSLADLVILTPLASAQTELARLEDGRTTVLARLDRARTGLAALHREAGLSEPAANAMEEASTAWLQSMTRDAVAAGGGILLSSQAEEVALGSYSKFSVLLRIRTTEEGLLAFLRQVEASNVAVIFQSLDVQQIEAGDQMQTLDATAAVSVFRPDASAS